MAAKNKGAPNKNLNDTFCVLIHAYIMTQVRTWYGYFEIFEIPFKTAESWFSKSKKCRISLNIGPMTLIFFSQVDLNIS